MQGFSLGLYEKALPITLTFEQKLIATKECGFDFLEISVDETQEKLPRLDWKQDKLAELKSLCFKLDMPIYTMCLSGNRKYPIGSSNNETSSRGVNIIYKAIDFAAQFGIRIVQLAGYDVYYDEESTQSTKNRFFSNLKRCVEYASTKSVILALETMENDFLNTIEKAMFYVSEINSPYLKIYPDTGNITNGSADVAKDILSGRGNIVAAHLKETKPGVFRDVPYGEGHVDFDVAINAYKSIGVKMFLAEFWHDGKEDWMQKTKDSFNFLHKKLNK